MIGFLKLLAVIIMILILAAIFLSPIYFMITQSWAAGFLFLVSWIPTTLIAQIFAAIIKDW